MSLRVCLVSGCPELIPAGQGRCHDHERERDKARGTSSERGYGKAHQALRRQWEPRVEAGTVNCARCHAPIEPGTPWDLGHNDYDRTKYTGPEHELCNRAVSSR